MIDLRQRGATLAVGLIMLTLVTLLGLAGASAAHVEQLLAQNEAFRENAASAASAGIEVAIREIVNSEPAAISTHLADRIAGSSDRFEVSIRFAGYETSLPQAPGTRAAGAHFEVVSTGFGSRHAVDRQRAGIMLVVASTAVPEAGGTDCEPVVPRHCHVPGDLERLSWQRIAVE